MVDTSWDRPGVDPESFFDAPEEQVASREQSPTTSSKIQSSEWENSELGKVMQSLSERPALVGRVRLLIACFDLGVFKRLSTLPVIWRQSDNGMAEFPSPSRAASPSLAQGGQLTSVRGAESGGEARSPHAEKQPPDARPEPMQSKISSPAVAQRAGISRWKSVVGSSQYICPVVRSSQQ